MDHRLTKGIFFPGSLRSRLFLLVLLGVAAVVVRNSIKMMRLGSNSTAVTNAMQKLRELRINFLAIDFDQTIIDIHTGGRWPGTVDELKEHIRPEFQQLLNACMNGGVHVAVVTFSQQPQLIKGILENMVGPDHAARIPVRGMDRSWTYNGTGSRDGKQAHIASAVEELEQSGEIEITKSSTVLIDDDHRNVRYALTDGVRAVWFNPDKPHRLLKDLAQLV